jgi:hypothetical protein
VFCTLVATFISDRIVVVAGGFWIQSFGGNARKDKRSCQTSTAALMRACVAMAMRILRRVHSRHYRHSERRCHHHGSVTTFNCSSCVRLRAGNLSVQMSSNVCVSLPILTPLSTTAQRLGRDVALMTESRSEGCRQAHLEQHQKDS